MTQITRYRENKELPKSIKKHLIDYFDYYYKANRNIVLFGDESPLDALPQYLTKAVTIGYAYDDLFSDFRKFFRPDLYLDCSLFEDLVRGLKPRFIEGNPTSEVQNVRSIIYKEADEVQEMFFINKGQIAVGYTYFLNNAVNQRRTHMTHIFGVKDFVGDHCVLFNLKSRFYYEAKTNVECFSLDKYSLITSLLKHPISLLHEF